MSLLQVSDHYVSHFKTFNFHIYLLLADMSSNQQSVRGAAMNVRDIKYLEIRKHALALAILPFDIYVIAFAHT